MELNFMTMVFGLAVLQLGLLLATSKVFGCPGCPHQFLKRHDSPPMLPWVYHVSIDPRLTRGSLFDAAGDSNWHYKSISAKTCTPSLLFKILESRSDVRCFFWMGLERKMWQGVSAFLLVPFGFPCYFLSPPHLLYPSDAQKKRPKTCRRWGSNKQIEWIRVAWWPTSHQTKCSLSLIETRSAKKGLFFFFVQADVNVCSPNVSVPQIGQLFVFSIDGVFLVLFLPWSFNGDLVGDGIELAKTSSLPLATPQTQNYLANDKWWSPLLCHSLLEIGVATPTRRLHCPKTKMAPEKWDSYYWKPWFVLECPRKLVNC